MFVLLLSIILSSTVLSAKTYTEVPADAKKVLESLPRKTVSLDFITQLAMAGSDSFKMLKAQFPTIEVADLMAKAPMSFNLDTGYNYYKSENEPDSLFGPTRLENNYWNLGFSKYFFTGTNLSVNMVQGHYTRTMPSVQFQSAYDDVYKTTAELTLTQNLWKDSFGYATRRNLKRGQLDTEVRKIEIDESIEEWLMGITGIFYRAWGAQNDARAAQQGFARRERLLGITQRKVSSGTGERPDLLQVRSAVAGSNIRLMNARETLDSIWRDLVMTLKLPTSWLNIDPLLIPVELDNPTEAALGMCSRAIPSPTINSSYRKALMQKDSANLAYEATRNNANPTLSLNLIGGGNGVDPTSLSTASSEATAIDHPHYAGMLVFKMPLNNYAGEAQVRQAMALRDINEAKASQAKNAFESDWMTTCDQLMNWKEKVNSLKQVLGNQKERVALEESRFRFGRVPLMNVIQSGDDETDAQINYNNAQIQFRLTAWKIKRMTGLAKTYLEGLAKK
ncbi:MAG: hypothetical protein A4S09_07395 [Proteobacteria bacterium SG_bin7]|nr:MAG: hypothetical protein A4S09_07395 [Proteobacteria bacterium SG_bin7]